MTSPSKTTNKQIQDAVHAVAMENLETSIFWNLSIDELNGMKSHIESNPRLNQYPAIQIAEIIRRRGAAESAALDHFGEMMEALHA